MSGRLPDPGLAAICARCGEPRVTILASESWIDGWPFWLRLVAFIVVAPALIGAALLIIATILGPDPEPPRVKPRLTRIRPEDRAGYRDEWRPQ